jgi:hypothetical protein
MWPMTFYAASKSEAVTYVQHPELERPLYHGSNTAVASIDFTKSVPHKDFGRGFYTTNDKEQAEKFARLKARRAQAEQGFVSTFLFRDADASLSIRRFDSSGEEWFDFVLCNRGFSNLASGNLDESYDIVIGPVANDAVGFVLNQFVAGIYGDSSDKASKDTAIRLLLTQNLHNQVFFGTERAIARLRFVEVFDVSVD